jgi:hypothetical protein
LYPLGSKISDACSARRKPPIHKIFIIRKEKRVNKHLTGKQIDGLLAPTKYAGLAAQFVDRLTGRK